MNWAVKPAGLRDLGAVAGMIDNEATAADGSITVTHGLGATPSVVIPGAINGSAPWLPFVAPTTLGPTTFKIIFRRMTDNVVAPAGQVLSAYWMAAL